jgi:5-methylthioribose kinase
MSDMYEFLKIDNIAAYLKSHKEISTVIDAESIVEINEVGDGNLNFVFIVKDKNGDGIVLKQALPYDHHGQCLQTVLELNTRQLRCIPSLQKI